MNACAVQRQEGATATLPVHLRYLEQPLPGLPPELFAPGIGKTDAIARNAMHQMTRDPAMAQALANQDTLPRKRITTSPPYSRLVSALGGDSAEPGVLRFESRHRAFVALLCSDGLTRHGSDNVTITSGRAPRRSSTPG